MNRTMAAALALAAVVGLAWWLWPTEADRVRRACHDLADAVSLAADEPDVARLSRAARLATLLSPDVRLVADPWPDGLEGRDQVMALVGQLRPAQGVTVTLGPIEVVVDEDGRAASARTVATIREPDAGGGPDAVDARPLTLEFRHDDRWVLREAAIGEPAGLRR